jgi:hypothetical protein
MRQALVFATLVLAGCTQMRQSLRGQELSYRGAWYCASTGCGETQMKRSTSGTREDGVEVASVVLQPRAALAFTAETAFERLDVQVQDCKGKSVELEPTAIKKPGEHRIGDENAKESWMIVLDRSLELRFGKKCRWTATVVATWSDGATFTSRAAIQGQ